MTQLAIGIVTLIWRLVVAGAVIAARWMLGGFIPRGSTTPDSDGTGPARGSRRAVVSDRRAR